MAEACMGEGGGSMTEGGVMTRGLGWGGEVMPWEGVCVWDTGSCIVGMGGGDSCHDTRPPPRHPHTCTHMTHDT